MVPFVKCSDKFARVQNREKFGLYSNWFRIIVHRRLFVEIMFETDSKFDIWRIP